jgi:hypothetical protein
MIASSARPGSTVGRSEASVAQGGTRSSGDSTARRSPTSSTRGFPRSTRASTSSVRARPASPPGRSRSGSAETARRPVSAAAFSYASASGRSHGGDDHPRRPCRVLRVRRASVRSAAAAHAERRGSRGGATASVNPQSREARFGKRANTPPDQKVTGRRSAHPPDGSTSSCRGSRRRSTGSARVTGEALRRRVPRARRPLVTGPRDLLIESCGDVTGEYGGLLEHGAASHDCAAVLLHSVVALHVIALTPIGTICHGRARPLPRGGRGSHADVADAAAHGRATDPSPS